MVTGWCSTIWTRVRCPPFERFEIPLLGKVFFESDREILSRAVAAAKRYTTEFFPQDVSAESRRPFGIDTPPCTMASSPAATSFFADSEVTAELRTALPDCSAARWKALPSRRSATKWATCAT